MDTVTKGAANEYLVTLDLWKRGFDVFRNMSPAGATDIVATKEVGDDQMLTVRVQVKSATGRLDVNETSMNDVLATVQNDGKVCYRVTPGLAQYFAGSQSGSLSAADRFALTCHSRSPSAIFGRLGFTVIEIENGITITLKRGETKPIKAYTFSIPSGISYEQFSHKVSRVAQQLLDESKTPEEMEKTFNCFPVLVSATANIISE